MRHSVLHILCVAILSAIACSTFTALAAPRQTAEARPKLVVGLVVDQMRWDYLYYYQSEYGPGGLRRLLDEGFSCDYTMINYVPTVTAIGHTSIYTGSVPAFHGIAGNSFLLGERGVSSCDDPSVSGIGTDGKGGKRSPANLLATTIGDELKMATDFKAKVFGVAIKDRAAILPAGHSADAAYWWDSSVGHFVTSTHYMADFPQWVKDFNATHYTAPKHNLNTSNEGVTMTFDMARAIVENEQLGQDEITDLLAVSISSTDAIAHTYSTRGKENHDVFMQLDKDLTAFLNFLDAQVGKGNYLLFLTADHGGAHNPNFMREHKQPAGGWDSKSERKRINAALQEKYGVEGLLWHIMDYRVYLNHHKADSAGLDLGAVKRDAVKLLLENGDLAYAADLDNIKQAAIPQPLKQRMINGNSPGRSGDIMVMTKPGILSFGVKSDYKGTSHSAWNPYDAHLPLVFMGWGVEHGHTNAPTFITDIAPTVCAMLHIQMPNACVGNPITAVTDR